jgi:hypothetical protein
MNKRIPLYLDTSAPGWMVQSDFDGTISLLDVTDTLLTRFGKPGRSWRTPGSAARSARANA